MATQLAALQRPARMQLAPVLHAISPSPDAIRSGGPRAYTRVGSKFGGPAALDDAICMEVRNMVGRSRAREARQGDAEAPVQVTIRRRARRGATVRATFLRRYEAAHDVFGRFAAAVDYARGSAAAAERAGVPDADKALEAATRDLIAVGDRLTKKLAKR